MGSWQLCIGGAIGPLPIAAAARHHRVPTGRSSLWVMGQMSGLGARCWGGVLGNSGRAVGVLPPLPLGRVVACARTRALLDRDRWGWLRAAGFCLACTGPLAGSLALLTGWGDFRFVVGGLRGRLGRLTVGLQVGSGPRLSTGISLGRCRRRSRALLGQLLLGTTCLGAVGGSGTTTSRER